VIAQAWEMNLPAVALRKFSGTTPGGAGSLASVTEPSTIEEVASQY